MQANFVDGRHLTATVDAAHQGAVAGGQEKTLRRIDKGLPHVIDSGALHGMVSRYQVVQTSRWIALQDATERMVRHLKGPSPSYMPPAPVSA